jgi:SSS family solute:Na+ symporter
MGAVLSTFNSVLNSASTIFSIDIYKNFYNNNVSDKKLVVIGKITSAILAVFAMLVAPLVADAPEGLYQLLQQLNGIFFIPIASIMIAGFFIKKISPEGAKISLFVGLTFYIVSTFILKVDLHFVHIWGIEFIINIFVMLLASLYYPNIKSFKIDDLNLIELKEWKHTKVMSLLLVILTITIYIVLGQN